MNSSAQNETPPVSGTHPDQWVEAYGDYLYRYALLRLRKPEVAEDLVQETFLAAFKTAQRFEGRSSEKTWLLGILKHKVIDYFRKAGRETSFTDMRFFENEGGEAFDQNSHWRAEAGPSAWKSEPERTLNLLEFWQTLNQCLSKLPPRVADIFMLREMEDVASGEICRMLSISESNLWVMLHRARMALRGCLEKNWFERDPA